MSVLVQPPQDEFELLIREARSRQRHRWMIAAAVVALGAGVLVAANALMSGTGSSTAPGSSGSGAAAATHNVCGIQVQGTWIRQGGQTVYREPGRWTHPQNAVSEVQCSGPSVWVVWPGVGSMMQQSYFGVHSGDGGRTWRPVFTERFFGMKAPHQLDAYFGVWTLRGPRAAYFTGTCPACGLGTASLWVTRNAGRTFRKFPIPSLTGYGVFRIRPLGDRVVLWARRFNVSVAGPQRRVVTVRVG